MRKLLIFITLLLVGLMVLVDGCKKEGTPEDKALYDELNAIGNFKYYKNFPVLRLSSAQSGHNPYFKVRFNAIAYAALTDSGRLPAGRVFPPGSVVVTELFDGNPGLLKLYAVMKKTSSPNAVNGWIWAEFQYDASTVYSVEKKGADCTSCHSTNSRDQVRIFNQFP